MNIFRPLCDDAGCIKKIHVSTHVTLTASACYYHRSTDMRERTKNKEKCVRENPGFNAVQFDPRMLVVCKRSISIHTQ